jgi:PTH1 family peptidyl-tRNA hydrolase
MFRRKVQFSVNPEWMIVGLGNPGPEYRGTRHNVGFEVIDMLSEKYRIKLDRSKHRAKFGLGMLGETPVVVVKPLTYMNLSGEAVAPLARDYSLKPERILVVADDLDLPLGKNRLRAQGSSGGHNGHKSLIHSLGTQEYPRLKIGIGSVDRSQTIDHVLGAFTGDERGEAVDALKKAVQGVERVILGDWSQALEFVNKGE